MENGALHIDSDPIRSKIPLDNNSANGFLIRSPRRFGSN